MHAAAENETCVAAVVTIRLERVLSCSAAVLRGKKSKIEEVFVDSHAIQS